MAGKNLRLQKPLLTDFVSCRSPLNRCFTQRLATVVLKQRCPQMSDDNVINIALSSPLTY